MDVDSQGRALRLLRQRHVPRDGHARGHPALPSLNPNSSREVVSSEDIDARHQGARRGACAALARLRARSPSEAGGVMGDLIWDAGCRLGEWWNSLPERVRSVVCAVALIGLIAVAGAIEGTAPSGMYY